jgi:hypothetical protein
MNHLSSVSPSRHTQQPTTQNVQTSADSTRDKSPGKTRKEDSESAISASDQDELGALEGTSLVEEIKRCLRSGEPKVATRHLRKLRGRALSQVSNEVIKMVKSLRKCPEGMCLCVCVYSCGVSTYEMVIFEPSIVRVLNMVKHMSICLECHCAC